MEPLIAWSDATDDKPATHRLVLVRGGGTAGANLWTLEYAEGADAMGKPRWVNQELNWQVFAAILNRVIPAAQG